MPPRLSLVTRLLAAAGLLLIVLGLGAIVLAIVDPARIRAQLPPVTIDAAAVGGALAALGVATTVLGLAHLVAAAGLRRGAAWSATAAVVLSATVGMLWLAAAVASLVSARQGTGFVAGGIGLACAGAAYLAAVAALISHLRAGRIPARSTEGERQA